MKLKNVGVANLSGFGSDGASVIIGQEKVDSKLKRNNPKMISIHCHNYRLALAILSFFKENTFLMTKLFNASFSVYYFNYQLNIVYIIF